MHGEILRCTSQLAHSGLSVLQLGVLSMALCNYECNMPTLSFHYSLWGDVHFVSMFHVVPHPSSSNCSLYLWLFECGKFHLVLKFRSIEDSGSLVLLSAFNKELTYLYIILSHLLLTLHYYHALSTN